MSSGSNRLHGTAGPCRPEALRIYLEGVAGFPLHDSQAVMGGVGTADLVHVCHFARLSPCVSWLSGGTLGLTLYPGLREVLQRGHFDVVNAFCAVLGDVGEPLSAWKGGGTYRAQDPKHASQTFWANLLVKGRRDLLVASVTARDRARLEIQDHPEAVSWVTASPAVALGNDCSPSAFRLLMRWHLGEPIIPKEWVVPPMPRVRRFAGRLRRPRGLLREGGVVGAPFPSPRLHLARLPRRGFALRARKTSGPPVPPEAGGPLVS